jgi:hypothetical protein
MVEEGDSDPRRDEGAWKNIKQEFRKKKKKLIRKS